MNLFEIEMEYRDAIDELVENQGAMSPELEARMEITRELFEKKTESYGLIIKEMKGECEQLDDLIAALQKKKKSREATIETLRGRLLSTMQAFDIEKFKTLKISMWISSSKKLKIVNQNLIPKKYVQKVIEYKVLNSDMKKDLEAGIKVLSSNPTITCKLDDAIMPEVQTGKVR